MRPNSIITMALLGLGVLSGCGDDTDDDGSGGTAGNAGDGGDSGSSGSAGKGGTGGKGGSGGTAGKGGTGGSAGTAGSGGMAGEGGLGGQGGAGGECEDKPDGEPCTLSADKDGICIKETCRESRCGDGWVDKQAGEDCDAGNDNGKDDSPCTAECTWVCSQNTDCTATECREAGECEAHRCSDGDPKPDDTTCGETSGMVCKQGECVVKPCQAVEDCKDDSDCTTDACVNNVCEHISVGDVDTDGLDCLDDCDDNDADLLDEQTWYQDCDKDGFAPDAAESKLTELDTSCAMPDTAPADCQDVVDGWTKVPPTGDDVDCDDSNADLRPQVLWYADCDEDGYAAENAQAAPSCGAPTTPPAGCDDGGWTQTEPTNDENDCDDAYATVNPGVTAWSDTPIPGVSNTNVDFDYNCDLLEMPQYSVVATTELVCTSEAEPNEQNCAAHTGWDAAVLPLCGEEAALVSCALQGDACVATSASVKQSCQ